METSKILVLTLVATAVISAGCIDSSQEDNPDQQAQPEASQQETSEETEDSGPRRIRVENEGKSFVPDEIEIEQGRKVEFVFDRKSGTHSMRIPELDEGTGVLTYESNETFTVTFEEEGTYYYICSVGTHAQQGMNGTITVT